MSKSYFGFPFLFEVWETEECKVLLKVVVKVSCPDGRPYDVSWMDDDVFPQHSYVTVLDVDYTTETHEFNNRAQALKFIKEWWAKEDLGPCQGD